MKRLRTPPPPRPPAPRRITTPRDCQTPQTTPCFENTQRTDIAETPLSDCETPRGDCRALRTELPDTSHRALQTTVRDCTADFCTTIAAFRSVIPSGLWRSSSSTAWKSLSAATLRRRKLQRLQQTPRGLQRTLHDHARRQLAILRQRREERLRRQRGRDVQLVHDILWKKGRIIERRR